MRTARLGTIPKVVLLAILFAGIIGFQLEYDATKIALSPASSGASSPELVRFTDMGFDSTFASLAWITTMPEIVDLFLNGHTEYLKNLAYVNALDPKLSYPYAFSVLTLPAVTTFPDALRDSIEIGNAGIANADPDWRIPYYMALNYYLELKDVKDAATYFNIAAETRGVPEYAARFATNFGIEPQDRAQVEALWATIYQSSNDPSTKQRALDYVERLRDFDSLEAAAKAYKARYGAEPTSTFALVTGGILSSIPQDPFGYTFIINANGTAGIDLSTPPS